MTQNTTAIVTDADMPTPESEAEQEAFKALLLAVLDAAKSLATCGTKDASRKLAFWASCMSAQQPLSKNGKMVRRLVDAGYMTKPLPTDFEAIKVLMSGFMFSGGMHKGLLRVEALDAAGLLDFIPVPLPTTLEEQRELRAKIFTLLTGYGFALKTISFGLFLLDCLHCLLTPIDVHHLTRLQVKDSKGNLRTSAPDSRSAYEAIEDGMLAEWRESGYAETIPASVYIWAKWELQRRKVGSTKASGDTAETHDDLSPRWY